MVEVIDRTELAIELESEDPPLLVEVLDEVEFEREHLPRAVNAPLSHGFERRVHEVIPHYDSRVVVYCEGGTCTHCQDAALRLLQMGYSNVIAYVAGKGDWQAAGLPVERG